MLHPIYAGKYQTKTYENFFNGVLSEEKYFVFESLGDA
jgi:hypothetical protein